MRGRAFTLGLCTIASATASCEAPPDPPEPPTYAEYDLHPERPAILRDVALIDDSAAFTRPYVPAHRTTMDGRVALRVQGGPPGTTTLAEELSFYLLVPERLKEPLLTGPPGAEILADPEPFNVPFPPALDPEVDRLGHHAICDPTGEFPAPGEKTNPYPCGAGGAHDCYDITVVNGTTKGTVGTQLWGTPVTVEVAEPKTSAAQIVNVTLGEPVAGGYIPYTSEWTEPAVTIDGRLLTGRLGRVPREWIHPDTGEVFVRPYDLAYSVLPEGASPCDVTGWTTFHPMSHAPHDPQMVKRYGLAAYPFRDAEGNEIRDGEDMGGTYPWVDREGANLFMAGVPGRMIEQSETRYPRTCVVEGCEAFEENVDWDRGFLVAGLWTHGKLVHIDGMINHLDWAIGVTPAAHYLVDLYKDPDGSPVPVRLGAGRFIDSVRNAGGPYPPGYTHNANILDSLEHLLNYSDAAKTITPADVVWVMSNGVATDEIAFDDFLDNNALIISNMQASVTPLYYEDGASSSFPRHWNGQVRELRAELPLPALYELDPEGDADIHIQNAATSLGWKVPSFGLVKAGTGRVEPAALGGVAGRGFWLSGANEIVYSIPKQSSSIESLYFGLFLDPRFAEGETRVLATFPDGSGVRLAGRSSVEYTSGGQVVHSSALPKSQGWAHLAWVVRGASKEVTLLHEGLALDRFTPETPLFRMTEGDLVIGQAAADEAGYKGVRGWIDDLKVFAYSPSPEVACNHARGTLAAVGDNATLLDVAQRYPAWAHDAVASAAGLDAGARFVCFTDHSSDYAAHLRNLPAGVTSVRDAILFPEGPLRTGAPRPDSTGNAFCLTCHHKDGLGGLSLAALTLDPNTTLENDPRRQPLQPPRRVFGNIPAGWIPPGPGPGSPKTALKAPPEGLLIDEWVLPSATAP